MQTGSEPDLGPRVNFLQNVKRTIERTRFDENLKRPDLVVKLDGTLAGELGWAELNLAQQDMFDGIISNRVEVKS